MAGVIPTLFINQMQIDSPQDVIAYLLKFMMANPGWTSSQIESSLLSMKKFVSNNTENIEILPGAIQSVLDAAVKRFFPDFNAKVSANQMSTNTYNLEISVTDPVGATVLTSNDFVIEDGEIKLLAEVRNLPVDGGK